jgi:hypothetical protein
VPVDQWEEDFLVFQVAWAVELAELVEPMDLQPTISIDFSFCRTSFEEHVFF